MTSILDKTIKDAIVHPVEGDERALLLGRRPNGSLIIEWEVFRDGEWIPKESTPT
jgi:hypothetical protein